MRKVVRVSVVLLLWAPIVVLVGLKASGDSADFSGFDMASKATAVLWTFDSPSLGVPAEPTGEVNFAFSETNLRSGPAGYGLGSIVWPGQVAASLPEFLQSDIERQSGQKFPTNVPNYPIRAESFFPQGPGKASFDAGTMHMQSRATETDSEGVAYLNKFTVQPLGSMGNQSSISSSGFDPDGVVAMAEASVNDVAFLAGMIKFDSVVSRLTARSNGETATVAGTTTISGASFLGTPILIDSSGVHVADQDGLDPAAQQQALNQALAQTGISIELSQPVDTVQGARATRALGGVLIRMKSSAIEPLVSALPADVQNRIRDQVTFDQDMTVQLGPAGVTAGAAKAIAFEPPALPVELPTAAAETTVTPPSAPVPDTTSSVTPSAPTGITGPVAIAPVRATSSGVPVWLVVALTILAFVSSRPLSAFADRVFATRAGGAACPDEEG